MDEGPLLNIENARCWFHNSGIIDSEMQTEMTGELLDRIEAELNEIRDEKEKVVKERDQLIK